LGCRHKGGNDDVGWDFLPIPQSVIPHLMRDRSQNLARFWHPIPAQGRDDNNGIFMIDTTKDIFAYASTLTVITDKLAIYNAAPAIFETMIPDGYEITDPVAVIDYPNANARTDTSSHTIRDVMVRVRVYAQTKFTRAGVSFLDTLPLHEAAEAIADAFTTARIPTTGGTLMGAQVSGPVLVPTETPSLGGRHLEIRWIIQET
jgi:hypothetical protein